jgi:CheY-like chemotaxis protein
MSKSQAGQLKLLVSRGNLSDFVADTCQNISTLVNRNSCSLQLDIAPGIDAWFDSDKIDKILYNLLSNAQKYNRSGGVVTVSLSTTNDNRDAVLSIADQGVGIAPERMKRLYSRFFDGDYRRINQTGTGIGLALTYELVNLHHGTIYCESKVDVGTKFTVVFPIGSEAYAEDEIDTEEKISVVDVPSVVSAKAEKSSEVFTSDEEQYHILIVEDNEELLDVMVQLLSRRYRVFTAHNGKQALNVIKREELDLIISDVMMPVMDGYELTRTIKNDPDYCQLPIVLLTAKVRASDRKEGLEFGADEYLTKPFSLDELQLRIDNIIANRERIKQRFMASLKNAADEPVDEHISNPDDVFLQKAIDCVERNIENSNYDRDAFSADMCVSSSTLYNKLRALTGNSITGFITSVRLKRACAIAKQNPQISIAELSDKVGFATPKYFSKCFKKEYGMLLREWLEKEIEN